MVCVESTESQNQTKPSLPELQVAEFEGEIKLVILEYFQNGDAIEVSFFAFYIKKIYRI